MLDFVRRAFRGGLEVILWINLILWTIGGGIVFTGVLSRVVRGGHVFVNLFLGGVIGFAVGLMSNILFGGLVSTFLNMDKNLEQLVQKETQIGSM